MGTGSDIWKQVQARGRNEGECACGARCFARPASVMALATRRCVLNGLAAAYLGRVEDGRDKGVGDCANRPED